MGTTKTRFEKIEYLSKFFSKSKESEKGYGKKFLIAQLMINRCCSRQVANEIVQSFIDSNKVTEVEENGEIMLYG